MAINNYLHQVGELVGKDELPQAIALLQKLLQNSSKLDEAIIHSARYNDLSKQIRMGTIDFSQANITKNQIRLGILQLIGDIEDTISKSPQIEQEASIYAKQWQAENAIVQKHSGTGDNVGRDKISNVHQNQQHLGKGDIVQGGKTTVVSFAVRWTIVAGLAAALLGWYLIWGRPEKIPTPDFEYYSLGKEGKVSAIAGREVFFVNKSKHAYKVKWTFFPSGTEYNNDTVICTYKYTGTYMVKLEAFSEQGKMQEIIKNCEIYSTDDPSKIVKVKIFFEGNEQIDIVDSPLLELPTVEPSWCGNMKVCERDVFKGVQPYAISGEALNDMEHCEINGTGTIEFVANATYRIFYTDKSTCTMKMERVPDGYIAR